MHEIRRLRGEIERLRALITKSHHHAERFKQATDKQAESLKMALQASNKKASLYAEQVASLSRQLSESTVRHGQRGTMLLHELQRRPQPRPALEHYAMAIGALYPRLFGGRGDRRQ